MDTGQQTLIKLDSSPEKPENLAASLSLPETAEEKKKLRTVGFYELNVLQTPKDNKDPEDTVKSAEVKDVFLNKEDGDNGQMGTKDGTQPHEDKDQSPVYFDQALPTSPKPCRKHSSPTCLCKECVENYINLCEEKKEETDVNDQESDELLTSEDSASDHSNRSRSDSDGSRQTISSEEYTCHAQVTLPYPDNGKPPECITRLSNAGLYEPNEDVLSKGNEEDKISQVASTAFFVQHPEEKSMQKKSVQLEQEEKVDIERGEPECEPLLRNLRRGGDGEYANPSICQWSTGCLKILGSFVASMIIFPAFLYAAYAWLPFDAPLMPDIPTRLVYTLRCASFASVPIILGVIIHGVSRLCASSYDPFKPREREVTIHRRFIKQGTFLFVLYFFNLAVLSTYLPQDHLKFIPLLTCLFALAQLLYWLSFAISRPFRSFGYGLTFLPLLAMMVSNLYFMFVVEPEKMVFLGHRNVPKN